MASYGYTFQNGDVVTPAKLNDARTISNIQTADIADSQITTAKIADANVTTAKIADGAVTNTKLSPSSINSQTNATVLTDSDEFIFWEQATGTLKKITKSNIKKFMNPVRPVARFTGTQGAHVLAYIFGGDSNETNWVEVNSGNIRIKTAGTYRVNVVYGNSFTTGYNQSGTGQHRFLQLPSTVLGAINAYTRSGAGDAPITGLPGQVFHYPESNSGSSGNFALTFTATANSDFAYSFAVISGTTSYAGGGYVEIEKLT